MNAAATPNATHMPWRCIEIGWSCPIAWSCMPPSSIGSGTCDEEEPAEERERAAGERPRPPGRQDHRRERDVDEIEEAERIEGAAGEVEHRRQQADVEEHDGGEHPVLDAGAAPPRCQREIARDPEREHAGERQQRQVDPHPAVDGEDGRELAGEGPPAERQEPGEVDAMARLGSRRRHRPSTTRQRRTRLPAWRIPQAA